MLEILCFGALALTTDLCASPEINSIASNTVELNNTATIYLAGRRYESDYTREAESIKDREDLRDRRNSNSRRYRNYRDVDLREGACIDATGRIYRNPDGECREERRIYRTPERRYERHNERRYERRNRIYREPDRR